MALAGAEVELAPMSQRERRLGRALGPIHEPFDYILIDCPPSLGLLTVNALTAADEVLIPLQCEYYALEGLTQLIATINLVRDHLNPALAIKGVRPDDVSTRARTCRPRWPPRSAVTWATACSTTVIPRSVRLSEAPSYGLPIATVPARLRRCGGVRGTWREEYLRRDEAPLPHEPCPATATRR